MDLQNILVEELPEITAAERSRLRRRIEEFVAARLREERDRVVEACRERGALWERTLLATSSLPSAVAEARARSNEAKYLADLFESSE